MQSETVEELYTDKQILSVIQDIGIKVDTYTANDYVAFCPFHDNTDSAAFSVSRYTGQYVCFSPSCGMAGTLIDLVKKVAHVNDFKAMRKIAKHKKSGASVLEHVQKQLTKKTFEPIPQKVIDQLHRNLWESERALEYMRARGFTDETLKHFEVGYCKRDVRKGKRLLMRGDMITVPFHDHKGTPVGMIGRSIEGKEFHNYSGTPTSTSLFNIHRTNRFEPLGIVESSFDVMTLWQLGYENVAATLGGSFNHLKAEQVKRYEAIWNMTDDDEIPPPENRKNLCKKCDTVNGNKCVGHNNGFELGLKIAELVEPAVYWPWSDGQKRLPAKDVGAMEPGQIHRIMNRPYSHSYVLRNVDEHGILKKSQEGQDKN